MPKNVLAVSLATILLFGCGGGSMQGELTSHDYSRPAQSSPNYHAYTTGSHVYQWAGSVHVGGDVEPRDKLRRIGTYNGITYSMGASRDGAGVRRIENYNDDLITEDGTVSPVFSDKGFYPFVVKPKIWLDDRLAALLLDEDPATRAFWNVLLSSINILNDALPPEFQIEFGNPADGSRYSQGSVLVRYVPATEIEAICSGGAACSKAFIIGDRTWRSDIVIPDDIDMTKRQTALTIIVHELLHALGIRGHVDSIEFPDSIMGKFADFFPNPGFTIHRIDREVLQIIYMSQHSDRYNDYGEWTDTSLHLVGESEDGNVNFGVALFNGLPQPWARGMAPDRILGFNPATGLIERPYYLFGSVTWEGALLAFSGISPVVGDARLTVRMNDLDEKQDLKFSDLTFFNKLEETGDERWFPVREIDYKVSMDVNGFYYSSDNEHVRGVFLGPEHEGMAGTIKRTDLVGAFGGTR